MHLPEWRLQMQEERCRIVKKSRSLLGDTIDVDCVNHLNYSKYGSDCGRARR